MFLRDIKVKVDYRDGDVRMEIVPEKSTYKGVYPTIHNISCFSPL
jgi:hypothetical protein